MCHGRFTDLYNPHWGRDVENVSFQFWDRWVGEVVGNNVGNRIIMVLFTIFFFITLLKKKTYPVDGE